MEEAAKALRGEALSDEERSAAGRALGSIVTPRKVEHARQIGLALKGKPISEELKAKQKEGRREFDERRKREAQERREKREEAAKQARAEKKAAKAAAKAAEPPKKRGRPPKSTSGATAIQIEIQTEIQAGETA